MSNYENSTKNETIFGGTTLNRDEDNIHIKIYLEKASGEITIKMNLNEVKISKMSIKDLDTIKNILEDEFDNFWNYNILSSELKSSNSKYFVLKLANEIIGFAGILVVLDETEITNIVIKKSYRGKHLSSILMKYLITYCVENNIKKIHLEVSSKNKIAINLYTKFGFTQVGLRKNYYKNSDAILMCYYNNS